MKVLIFLQARTNSSRLPGKVMLDLLGEPMLIRQVERLKNSTSIDGIVVLTSNSASDDELFSVCRDYGVECFRGSLNNVLERFYQAYQVYKPDHIVRITGDCPLIDWTVLDEVVDQHLMNSNDYTSNTLIPTYPDGLDVEVFTKNCLMKMYGAATTNTEKEHVTYYSYSHKDEFKLQNIINPKGDRSGSRWTVDNPEDFLLVKEIYTSIYPNNDKFLSDDIDVYLDKNKSIKYLNHHLKRNEGLDISISSEQNNE